MKAKELVNWLHSMKYKKVYIRDENGTCNAFVTIKGGRIRRLSEHEKEVLRYHKAAFLILKITRKILFVKLWEVTI